METVHLHRDGAIARISFDDPPHNCLTTAMFAELGRHVREIDADPYIRVALLSGTGGKLFTVGADIREMDVHARLENRRGEADRWLGEVQRPLSAIEASS
jgi:enoyl-CoA hydratase/carnithine racemase